jgi:2-dehydro-3-deoxygalactonokinase
MSGLLIGVDWGGSNLRAFRFDAAGGVVEARTSLLGVSRVADRAFEAALASVVGDWRDADSEPLEILMCGMIGARGGGWVEAPYVPCPAGLEAVAGRCASFETGLGMVRIAPGLSARTAGGLHDVLRGEETQIFGAIEAPDPALVIAPGTHSKWCRVAGGRVLGFRTWMTGELFAVLCAHSILGQLMHGDGHDENSFLLGVRRGLDDPDLLGLLFSVRGETLFGALEPVASSAYLSGLLIGAEIRAGLAETADTQSTPIVIVGDLKLAKRYRSALDLAGAPAERIIDGAQASARGLWRLARIGADA